MRGVWCSTVVLVLTLVATGCRDKVPRPAAVDPVSMSEAEAFARRFEAAMEPCSASKLAALTDIETLLRRAVGKADAPASDKRGFLEGARSSMSAGSMLCQASTGTTASYDLLRIRVVDGQPRPLFRALYDDTVNYHELHLGKSKVDHEVRVLDLHSYISGELMSDTLAHMLEQGVASAKQGDNVASAAATLGQLSAAQAAGDHDEVRRLIGRLPPKFHDMKPIRLIELMAAAELDDATYADLIASYERLFPGDASLDLVSVDGYFLRKDGPAALAALERLDQRLGGDPYLGLLRASALQLDPTPEHLADAERWAKVTTDAMPTLENGWWTLASVRLLRNDHAGLVPLLEKLEADFGAAFDLDAMRAVPGYESFLRSPEFEAWWARRASRASLDADPDAPHAPTAIDAHRRPDREAAERRDH